MTPEREDAGESPAWWVGAFDRSYAERYAHRDDEEARRHLRFFLGEAGLHAGQRALDLCCGTGRHSALLEARGLQVISLDYSADLLEAYGRRMGEHGLQKRGVRGNMLALPFVNSAFECVIQMFTAFGYFEEDALNQQALHEVARVLRNDGRYVLDLMNRDRTLRQLVPESSFRSGSDQILERRHFDAQRGRINKSITIQHQDGRQSQRQESVRVFSEDEIRSWLGHAGFTHIRAYGDFEGASFAPASSERMILVSRS